MDETSKIDTINNTVSYTTTHFSTYMLVDKEQWYNVWKDEIDYRTIGDDSQYYDIAFVVDTSGSMDGDNAIEKTKIALHTYVEKMYDKDRAGLVRFSEDAEILCGLESTRETLTEKINSLFADGGTDTDEGLKKGLQLLSTATKINNRIVILICDGDVNYVQSTIDKAIENDIKIYTLNVGYSASSKELKQISNETGGEYFFAKDSDDILNALLEIQSKTINYVDTTDTDGDGLYDIYETKGIRIPNGQIVYSDPLKTDTDGDDMTDYEEVGEPVLCSLQNEQSIHNEVKKSGVSALSTKSTPIYAMASKKYVSNPKLKDTDGDGIPDKYDPKPKKHFGKINRRGKKERNTFKIVSKLNYVPQNKTVAANLANASKNEWDVYKNRFSKEYKADWHQALQVLSIKTRARTTADAGIVVSTFGTLNRASQFFAHYNNSSGKYYWYGAKNIITKTKDGKEYYKENVNYLLEACENAVKKGRIVTISSVNNAGLQGYRAMGKVNLNELDVFLSIATAEAAMTGQCTYDGKKYTLKLNYYIEDCYDFYEEDPKQGKAKRVGGCTNDELVILSYYDEAKPFISIGQYIDTITWEKGYRMK